MKRVILTGSNGFLGNRVLHALLEDNIETLAVENRHPILLEGNYQKIKGGTAAITTKLIDDFKPDAIIHCARPTISRFKRTGRKIAARKAASINRKLLRHIQNSNQKPKLVFASGSLMYGNHAQPHDENSPLRPISYARQYYRGEIPINRAATNDEPCVIILRFPWLLGNGSWFKWFFIETIKKHRAIAGIGSMDNQMEIIDVDDAGKLMMEYARSVESSGIYNIYSKKPVSQAAFVKATSIEFNVPVKAYSDIFKQKMEKEAIEAFSSNILLKSGYNDILAGFKFTSLEDTLKKIRNETNIP